MVAPNNIASPANSTNPDVVMNDVGAQMDEEEVKVYDRQIRIWGPKAQERIRSSKVLVVGMGTLSIEVLKNLILIGVKSAVIMDDQLVTNDDYCGSLFLQSEAKGTPRATASLKGLTNLNPHVQVTVEICSVRSKHEDFFNQFDMVLMTESSFTLMAQVNEICRKQKVKFMCGGVHGFYGFSFADYGQYHCFEEKEEAQGQSTVTEYDLSFNSWQSWMDARFTPATVRKMPWVYFGLLALDRFYTKESRLPFYENKANKSANQIAQEDKRKAVECAKEILLERGLPMGTIPEESMMDLANGSRVGWVATAAVIGGILTQEIIKALSGKDRPLMNTFLYDSRANSGVVHNIPSN